MNHSRAEATLGEEAVHENCCSYICTFQMQINSFLTCIHGLPAICLVLLLALLFHNSVKRKSPVNINHDMQV